MKSGQNLFNAVGYPGCTVAGQPGNKWDGCTTKNFFGLALAFTPTWFQVFPGVDLSAPITYRDRPEGQRRHRLRRQPGATATTRSASAPTSSRSTAST